MNHEIGVLQGVLIVVFCIVTILQNSHGVCQGILCGILGIYLTEEVIVVAQQTGKAIHHLIVLIHAEQGRLHHGKVGRRSQCALAEVSGEAVVEEFAVGACHRDIKLGFQVSEHLDIRVKAQVHTVKACVLQRALGIHVAHGEVVHTHIVTTLHIDAVVLGQCLVIHLILPVGVVVIHVIIVAIGIVVKEAEIHLPVLHLAHGTYHLGGIGAEL